MSRSTAALLIAIMFHILLLILFYFLMHLNPKKTIKPEEHRIKVALKERPKPIKKLEAPKKAVKPIVKAPPMPKGRQLKKIEPKLSASKIEKTSTPPKTKPIKKSVVATKLVKKPDLNTTKKPFNNNPLYAMLSKPDERKAVKKKPSHSSTHISSNIKEAYGDKFGELSEGEKKYIIDNQEIMRRITQEQLNRLGPVNIPKNLHVDTGNIIEFYLHPSGDISGLKIISASGYEILDETSLQTVEYSYHRYPLPKQKTLVRYKVGYYLAKRRH